MALKDQEVTTLKLTKQEAIILANFFKNDYLPHEEPIRSLLLRIHFFAESK